MSALGDDARAATRGGASLLVLQTFGRLLGLAFVVTVTRVVEPAEFGRYAVVAALVVLGNFLADFGTSPAMTRLVTREPGAADRLLSGTLPLSLALGLVVYAGIAAFAVLADYSSTVVTDILVGAVAVPVSAMLSSVLGALDGAGLIARRSLVTFAQTAVVAVGGAGAIVAGASVRAAVVALAVAPAVSLVMATAMARRAGVWRSPPRLDRAASRRLLRAAAPFALIGGLTALSMRFDVILLSLLRSPAQTATYDLALRLLESLTYLSAAICAPSLFLLGTRLGRHDRDGARRAYQEAARALYLIGLPLSVGLAVLGRDVAGLALGADFSEVGTPFAIMGAAQWLLFVVYLQGALVLAGDAVAKGTAVAALNTLVTLALDVALVPAFGPTGAAVAMVASWTFSAVAFDRLHRRSMGMATPLPAPAVLLSSLALLSLLVALRPVSPVLAAVVGGAGYLAALVATRAVQPSDVERLRAALRPGRAPVAD